VHVLTRFIVQRALATDDPAAPSWP